MPTAPVDSHGTEIFFTDSGPVNSPDYTTLVVYHGVAFTGDTFHKVLPFAQSSNIRLVIVARRSYKGSTQYREDELEDIRAGRNSFMERQGNEVANFLRWFVDTNRIPKIRADRRAGGFSIMGWSLGCLDAFAFLGQPDAVIKASYQILEPYLRQILLYDPGDFSLGCHFGNEDNIYSTPQDFMTWASNYYINKDLTSRAGARFTVVDSNRRPSVDSMTPDDLAVNVDLAAAAKCDFMVLQLFLAIAETQAEAALFNEQLARTILPELQIIWLACKNTPWALAWCKTLMQKKHQELIQQGCQVRPIKFIEIEGANHFLHWDDPEKFWEVTVDAVQN